MKNKKTKSMELRAPKGMHDVLPKDQHVWEKIKKNAREIAEFYNFFRIDTPIMEKAELFELSVGAATDVVEKQMFTLTSKGKERLVLRPEGTASVARSYLENGLSQMGSPLKLYYEGPMFRYEQPQAGRTRQFYQIGFEIISNEDDPIYDTQCILTLWRLLESLKIKNLSISVNSIGCNNCRPVYRKQLQNYYKGAKSELCPDCLRRLEANPLRLLDCKEEKCKALRADAPIMVDNLCKQCDTHFKTVLEYLDELGLPYGLDHYLVRGLDYYTKTVFEVVGAGFDFSLAGGGRYDYLIELLGGRHAPAVGWAISLERIIEVLKLQNIVIASKARPKTFLIYIGELAKKRSLVLIEDLRKANIDVAESLGKESLNAQLRAADKAGAPLALIFGQKEAFEEAIIIRDLKSGVQETMPLKKMVEAIRKKLK